MTVRKPDYAILSDPNTFVPFLAPVMCAGCREPYFAGHICPRLRDLSPLGGGPKP